MVLLRPRRHAGTDPVDQPALPPTLLDREDLEKASAWFHRHGRASVFFGRLVPGVRSLISLPAGAQRMPLATFTLFTAVGSGLWNSLLVGVGYAFATQWDVVGHSASPVSSVVLAALIIFAVVALARRAHRRRHAPSTRLDPLGRAPETPSCDGSTCCSSPNADPGDATEPTYQPAAPPGGFVQSLLPLPASGRSSGWRTSR